MAGFPCQPFSSSGALALGFGHQSGHVFEHLTRLIRRRDCQNSIVLENVEGLLSNKSGHTFCDSVLRSLTQLGYAVDWLVVRSALVSRATEPSSRLFVVAAQPGALIPGSLPDASCLLPHIGEEVPFVFTPLLAQFNITWSQRLGGSLADTIESLRPAIGKTSRVGPKVFGGMGHANSDGFATYDLLAPSFLPPIGSLASIVAPEFPFPESIRIQARYWSPKGGGGAAGLHLRDERLSHCVGTSLGGAPLFAVPLPLVSKRHDREAFLGLFQLAPRTKWASSYAVDTGAYTASVWPAYGPIA